MSEDPSGQGLNPQDFSEVGRYAEMMRIQGRPIQDYIQSNTQDNSLPSAGDDKNDILDYYEQNKNRMLDIDAPDGEKNWGEIKSAFADRHTDYMKLFGDTVGEIASLPLTLIEGMAENPNPAVWAGSTIEGTGRAIRDMWGLAAQSENPTSPLFRFKSAIGALIGGKPTANWREEAQQWNDARRFLWHSTKIQNGDEVLLDQMTKLSDSDRQTIQSFVNPKIAHAMGYIGLELPALLSSAFTGGAGAALALEAGSAAINAGSRAAQAAKVGKGLAGLTSRFENYSSKLAGKMATGAVGAVGRAIEGPATYIGNMLGGATESVAGRIGRSSAEVRNVVESTALDLGREIGVGEVQATVGVLGSLGLRTISEVAKEIGMQGALRSAGVVEASGMSGLTLLEKVATSPLSKSGQAAAKFLSYTVDPVIQMSTSALKSSYKGGLEFAVLGYLNDKDKGAVSGAAMGMVWSGYSGAVRHLWSVANGGMSHALIIKNFDERSMPHYEKLNSDFATVARTIIADADRMGSSKISANIRTVLQMAADSGREKLKDLIVHMGSGESLKAHLESKGIHTNRPYNRLNGSQASLHYEQDASHKQRPVLFINDASKIGHRSVDVAHEIMGHLLNHYMLVDGHMPEFFHQFFSTKKDGGVITDQQMIDSASQIAATQLTLFEQASHASEFKSQTGRDPKTDSGYVDFLNKKAKENFEMFRIHFSENVLGAIRNQFTTMSDFLSNDFYKGAEGAVRESSFGKAENPALQRLLDRQKFNGPEFGAQFLFEEIVASRSEHLFMHTNLASMTTPDALMPLRMMLEARRDSMFASNVTHLELAGMKAENSQFIDADGRPSYQTMAHTYDNGKMVRWPEMDSFIKSYVKKAVNSDAQPVSRLSPERQAVEAKRFGKEFLFNAARSGMTMKGSKEVNEVLAERAQKGFEVLMALDESIRPEVIEDQHGNGRVDMTRLNPKAWDALVKSGAMDDVTATYGKAIADVMRQHEMSGFSTPNIMTGVYWGDSHEIIRNGLLERLRGTDVPITHRVFVPFEMNMTQKLTDANGRRLKNPKFSLNVTAIDYLAIHRRKVKAWSRGDVQAMFFDIGHMNQTFDSYMINMMQEPSRRVPSEQLFYGEFGPRAAQVRDICHQIFGAVKRGDESYINTPVDGHQNVRGPNFPINSFKLELMVDVARSPSTPFPYHHGRSYEGFRRNLSVAGFEKVGKGERYMNSNGYEILKSGTKYKVFTPFGVLMDAVDSIAKAAKIADRDIRKMDPADRMPAPSESFITQGEYVTNSNDYKDVRGAYLNNFTPEGLMLSIGRMENGKYIRLDEELHPSWATLKSIIGMNDVAGVSVSPDKRATLRDIMTSKSVTNFESHEKKYQDSYEFSKIAILPRIHPDNPKLVGKFLEGPSYADTGRYSELKHSQNTGSLAIYLDMDYIESLPSNKAKHAAVKAAVDFHLQSLSSHLNGEKVLGAGPFLTTIESMNGAPDLDTAIAAVVKNHIDNPNLVSQSQSSARSDFASKIAWADNPQFDSDLLNMENTGTVTRASFRSTGNTNKKFGTAFSKFLASNPNANQIKRVAEGIRIALELAREFKNGDFGTSIGESGVFSAPNCVDVNGNIEALLKRYDKFHTDCISNSGELELNTVNEIVSSSELLHSVYQVSGVPSYNASTIAGNVTKTLGISSLSRAKKNGMMAYTGNVRYQVRSQRSALTHPIVVFPYSGDGSVSLSEFGNAIVIESGKNYGGGSWAKGNLESPPSKFEQTRNFNRMSVDKDGLPVSEHLDALIAEGIASAQGKRSLVSNAYIAQMSHIKTVANEIVFARKDLEQAVDNAYENFKKSTMSTSDRIRLAEEIQEIAVNEDVRSAIIPASVAVKLEKSQDASWLSSRLSSKADYSTNTQAWHDRAMREAKAEWNQVLKHYLAVSDGDKTRIEKANESLYSSRWSNSNSSKEQIAQIVKHAKEQADISHDGMLHTHFPATGQEGLQSGGLMLSVAGVESLRDEFRINDLVGLGLVRRITDRSGNVLHVFEFSDKEAGLNMDRNGNKPFLTPFVGEKNPEFAFANYQKSTESGEITKRVLSTTTLGEVFTHDSLYFYYPELKKLKVEFFDGHGGQYASPSYSGGEMIRLGARMFCASELMRSMDKKEGGTYLRSKESLMEKFASANPAASVILHEVQHALQERSKGMDRSLPLTAISTPVMMGFFANLMGIEGSVMVRDMQTAKMQMQFGQQSLNKALKIEHPWVDPDSFYRGMHNDPSNADKTIMALGDSPVFKSLHASARPILISALGELAGFCAENHDNGKVPLNFAERAIRLFEESKSTMTDERMFEIVNEFEEMNNTANRFPEWGIHQIGDTQFKTASQMLGAYSSIALIKSDKSITPIEKMTLLRHAVKSFATSSYLLNISETMARETQRRAGMSNVEIASKHRTDTGNFPFGSTLDLIDRAMESSKIITQSELGGKLREAYDGKSGNVGIVMNSIGGIGEKREDSRVLSSMAKAMLVHYFGHNANAELAKIGRIAVQQRGWEVREDGKVILTDKNYILKGDTNKFGATFGAQEGQPVSFSGLAGDNKSTLTIADICRLADVTVESEAGLSIGNPVIDMVLAHDFPDQIRGEDIVQQLVDRGFMPDDDAVRMSDIYNISKQFSDVELTRHDITNLIALRHSYFESTSFQHGAEGTPPSSRSLDIKDVTRDKALKAIGSTGLGADSITNNIGFPYNAESGHTFRVGTYQFQQGKIAFEPAKPSWADRGDWDAAVARHKDSVFHKQLQLVTSGRDAEQMNKVVNALNSRLQKKLLLIEPVLKECMQWALSKKDSHGYPEFIASLLDDAFLASMEVSANAMHSGSMREFMANLPDTMPSSGYAHGVVTNRLGIERANVPHLSKGLGDTMPNGRYLTPRGGLGPLMVGTAWHGIAVDLSDATTIYTGMVSTAEPTSFSAGRASGIARADLQRRTELGNTWEEHGEYLKSIPENGLHTLLYGTGSNGEKFGTQISTFRDAAAHQISRIEEANNFVAEKIKALEAERDNSIATGDTMGASVRQAKIDELIEATSGYGREKKIAEGLHLMMNDQINANSTSNPLNANRLHRVRMGQRTNHQYDAAVDRMVLPSTGIQAFRIGDRAFFSPEPFLPDNNASSQVSHHAGIMSGFPADIKRGNIAHSFYSDLTYPLAMHGEMMVADGNGGEVAGKITTPSDRYTSIISRLKKIHRGGDEGTFFSTPASSPSPYLQSILGGNALLETGLFTHAVRHARDAGMSLTDMVTLIGGEEMQRVFGDADSPIGKVVPTVPHQFVLGDKSGVSVGNSVIGAMSSPLVRMILARGIIDRPNGSPRFGTPAAFTSALHAIVVEHAMRGEYEKHSSEVSPEASRALDDFIKSIPDTTIDRLALEMSSVKNIETISTAIGASMAYQVAELQEANPAAFQHTIKKQFVPSMGADGLGIRKAVDHCIVNSEHLFVTGTTGTDGVTGWGTPVAHAKTFASALPNAVRTKDFWHGYFASLAAHDEIMVPNIEPTGPVGPDYAYRGTTGLGPDGIKEQLRDGVSLLKHYSTLPHERFLESIHGFHQGFQSLAQPIGIFSVYRHETGSLSRQSLEKYDPQGEMRRKRFKTPRGEISLSELIENNKALHVSEALTSLSATQGVEVQSGTKTLTMPVVKDTITSELRRKVIRQQLAEAARSLGTDKVSTPAARFQVSGRIPTTFMGMNASNRYEFTERSTNNALHGYGGDYGTAVGSQDIPRMGVSWKRLSDGRIMLNYTADIDTPMLSEMSQSARNAKIKIGIPFRKVIGFDAHTGTIIPQSFKRMADLAQKLGHSGAMKKLSAASHIRSLLSFDKEVQRHYGKAVRLIASDVGATETELGMHNHPNGEKASNSKLAQFLGSNGDFYDPETDSSSDHTDGQTNHEKSFELVNDGDHLIHLNNQTNSYATLILPADSKPEHIQAAISSFHIANAIYAGKGLIGISNDGMDRFHFGKADSVYADRALHLLQRVTNEPHSESGQAKSDLGFNLSDSNASAATNNNAQGVGVFRDISSRNPNFIPDINEASMRIHGSDSGYFIPEAERRLQLHGDREAVIRLMFPNREDLTHYAWDKKSGGNNISVVKKSGKNAGYLVGHDVVTDVDSNGIPKTSRKVVPFRTESDANAYVATISQAATEAHIPKSMYGDGSRYHVESLGQTKMIDGELQPVRSVSFKPDDTTSVIEPTAMYRVGDIEKPMTKQEALAVQKLLMSNDMVSGKAPERGTVMLSVGGTELGDLERVVRNKMSFGTAGSMYRFSSRAMRALAFGADRNKNFKEAMTGQQMFDLLQLHGVTKHEMRVTGLADMLYRNKDEQMSRLEISQFVAAVYPMFGRHTISKAIGTDPATYHWPVVSSGEWANNQNTMKYLHRISKAENNLKVTIDTGTEGQRQHAMALSDIIRKSFKDAIAEGHGLAAAEDIPADMHVADYILKATSSANKANEGLRINPSTLELFRQNMVGRSRDESVRQAAEAAGFDVGNLTDGFHDDKSPAGMTLDEQNAFRAKANTYDSSGVAHTGGTPNWGQYASGLGPYQVNVLHGHASDTQAFKRMEEYGMSIRARIAQSTDPKEVAKLNKILESVKNVTEVRKALIDQMRNSGHWNSPHGSMQYSHLRTSDGASVLSSNIGAGITELSESISRGSDVMPINFVEELQSDPYQRSTFGPKAIQTTLAGDFKEAEGMAMLPAIRDLELKIKVETDRMSNVVGNHAKTIRTNRYLSNSVNSAMFEHRFELSSRIVQHLMVEKAKSTIESHVSDEHVKLKLMSIFQEDASRPVSISKAVQDKVGLPPKIPTYVLDKSSPYYDSMCRMLGNIFVAGDSGHSTFDGIERVYGDTNPNVPVPPHSYQNYGTDNISQLKQIIFNEMCRDEELAAVLPAMLEASNLDGIIGKHPFDYEALAKRVAVAFEARIGNSQLRGTNRMIASTRAQDMHRMAIISGNEITVAQRRTVNPSRIHVPDGDQFEGLPYEWAMNHDLGAKRLYIMNQSDYQTGMEAGVKLLDSNMPKEATSYMDISAGRTARALSLTPMEAMRIDAMLGEKFGSNRTRERVVSNYRANLLGADVPLDIAEHMTEAYREILMGEKPQNDVENMKILLSGNSVGDGHEWRQLRTFDHDYDSDSLSSYRMGLDAPVSKTFQSKSMLGRLCEAVSDSLITAYSSNGAKVRYEELLAKRDELQKKSNVPMDSKYTYPNTIPLGEDNAYRSMSINFLVMDALQQGKAGIAWADARHHRTRYSSTNYSASYAKFGNKVGQLGNSSKMTAYLINHCDSLKAHGDFFGKVARGEWAPSHLTQVEHNGVTENLIGHYKLAVAEGFADAFKRSDFSEQFEHLVKSTGLTYANAFEHASDATGPEKIKEIVRSTGISSSDSYADVERKLSASLASGSAAVAIPYDKMHGYAVNYGIPKWMAEIQYTGQGLKSILSVSHDAFDVPEAKMEGDSWSLYDKTGKKLEGGITDVRMLQERRAQLSKYLGNVPFVTNFIKQYGPAGGHVKRAHMLVNRVKNAEKIGLSEKSPTVMQSEALDAALATTGNIAFNPSSNSTVNTGLKQKVFAGGVSPDSSFNQHGSLAEERSPVISGLGLYGDLEQTGYTDRQACKESRPRLLMALHAMGLRDGASDAEFSAAVAEATNFTSPLMVIKPEFPTQAHADNMKKLIINGVPLLSVSGFGRETTTKAAVGIMKTYLRPYKSNYRQDDR